MKLRPLVLAAAVFTLCCAVSVGHAQYFGQNKVRYRSHDFKVLRTPHFDIYYYDQEAAAAEQAGRMAERWYVRLAGLLNHELSSRQPLILYASPTDFQGTTVFPGFIGEGTGGVTEGLRRRIVMPFAGPLAETDHVLGHELVHAFQYDIGSRGESFAAGLANVGMLPLWFIEGMAEYLSLGPADPHTAMWMRDAVARGEIPRIRDLNRARYFPYRYGHAFWAYVGGRYGDEVIGRMLAAAAGSGSAEAAIQSVLSVSPDELSDSWREALIAQYRPVLETATPLSDQGRRAIAQPESGGEINVSPSLSPDGRWIAFFSQRDLFSIDIYLADTETGRIRRRITESALDPHYNNLEFATSAGAWSHDGRYFAYPQVRNGTPEISLYEVAEGRTVRSLRLRELDAVFNPTWSPDGNAIAFSGLRGGVTDLFIVNVRDGSVRTLVQDAYADLQPAWSPDGRQIVFVTDRFTSSLPRLSFGDYRLAVYDLGSGAITEWPGLGDGKQIDPHWSPDGTALYFVSDQGGLSDIYRYSPATRQVARVTSVPTGVTGITALSPAISVASVSGRLAYSAFFNRGYEILLVDSPEALADRRAVGEALRTAAGTLPPPQRASDRVASFLEDPERGLISASEFETHPYSASLSLDYVAPPSLSVGIGSFGTLIAGGTALHFSDLLGYHDLTVAFQTSFASEAGSIHRNLAAVADYRNRRHRWIWGVSGGQVPLISGSFAAATGVVGGQPAFIEQSVSTWEIYRQAAGVLAYPFNRALRLEFTSGYENVSFAAERRTTAFSLDTGQLLLDEEEDLPTPAALHMATGAAALVYDTSLFGGTSPIVGQSFRFEGGYSAGSLTYFTALADFRRYYRLAGPLSLAGRVLHYGRYGGDSEDVRLQPLFIGYDSFVRGYQVGSFRLEECGPALETLGTCPVFDQLLGSRIGVANAELRLQLIGPIGLLRTFSAPPVEIAPFVDGGVAWTSTESPSIFGGSRSPVSSYGASLRFNLLGVAVGQISYSHPNDRPLEGWVWSFSFVPGF